MFSMNSQQQQQHQQHQQRQRKRHQIHAANNWTHGRLPPRSSCRSLRLFACMNMFYVLITSQIIHNPCHSFSSSSSNTPSFPNNDSSGDRNSNNNNNSINKNNGDTPNPKFQTTSQRLRQEEYQRRIERTNENIPGRTSAIPGSKNLPINPTQTQNEWYNQATNSERQVKELTTKAMDYLKGLELEKARDTFEILYRIKPNAYCWHYGIVLFYLGEYYDAARYFVQNAKTFESRFGIVASEERIWRDACELKIMNDAQYRKLKGKVGMIDIAQMNDGDDDDDDDTGNNDNASLLLQGQETRKVVRIARDLFSSSIERDVSNETLARGKLRSICGEYEITTSATKQQKPMKKNADKKMWRLSSWFYLGLHYDVLHDDDTSRDCMKMALRQCGSTFGNGDDSELFFKRYYCFCDWNVIRVYDY